MAAGGVAGNIRIGPGRLYVGPVGATDPASASAAIPSAYRPIGYTEDGNIFEMTAQFESIYVEEEKDPVRYESTTRTNKVTFKMAEATRRNLALATNQGGNLTNDASPIGQVAPGAEQRVKLIWDSEENPVGNDQNSRIIFYRCINTGNVAINRRKGNNKTLLPVELGLEKDDTAPALSNGFWQAFPNANGLI